MQYRVSRNIEASIIDFITSELTSTWNNVSVVKTFQQIKTQSLPAICVRVGDTQFTKVQIGDNSLIRTSQVFIDIFATSDGLRLDLIDFLVDIIKEGVVYYEFEITKANRTSSVTGQDPSGRISVKKIDVTDIDLNIDKSQLDPRDRYRSLITLEIQTGKVE